MVQVLNSLQGLQHVDSTPSRPTDLRISHQSYGLTGRGDYQQSCRPFDCLVVLQEPAFVVGAKLKSIYYGMYRLKLRLQLGLQPNDPRGLPVSLKFNEFEGHSTKPPTFQLNTNMPGSRCTHPAHKRPVQRSPSNYTYWWSVLCLLKTEVSSLRLPTPRLVHSNHYSTQSAQPYFQFKPAPRLLLYRASPSPHPPST